MEDLNYGNIRIKLDEIIKEQGLSKKQTGS